MWRVCVPTTMSNNQKFRGVVLYRRPCSLVLLCGVFGNLTAHDGGTSTESPEKQFPRTLYLCALCSCYSCSPQVCTDRHAGCEHVLPQAALSQEFQDTQGEAEAGVCMSNMQKCVCWALGQSGVCSGVLKSCRQVQVQVQACYAHAGCVAAAHAPAVSHTSLQQTACTPSPVHARG